MIRIDENDRLDLSKLYPNQVKFIKSNHLHTAIVGGYQSGKSEAAVIKVFTKLLINPQVPCAYYLPTYGLIEDMLVPKFKKLFERLDVGYVYNQKNSKFTTRYGAIWMRSMDNPDRIVSYSVGYSLVDEADVVVTKKMTLAYGRIVSRNSFKTDSKNCIDFVTTPEGFGFMHKLFVKNDNENKLLLRLSTLDNAHNLGDGYIQGLKEAYTEEQLKAYLGGQFVNLTSGTVYRNYDRKLNHTDRVVQKGDVLHVGMDFNITNMSAIIHVIEAKRPLAVAELTGIYDTAEMIEQLREIYPKHKIVIYPDASGKNRKTSGKSDIELLKKVFTVRERKANPFVRDRVNKMNLMFKDNKGYRAYLVNSNECPVYVESLEQQVYKNSEPDKAGGFDHPNDAGGYFIYSQGTAKRTRVSAG
ncbi:MAG: terminase large subunit [Proteobacteria bacterium]|nr:terminase large subunit [Pseudomonadota bacterium]